jgi:hypothetical protein
MWWTQVTHSDRRRRKRGEDGGDGSREIREADIQHVLTKPDQARDSADDLLHLADPLCDALPSR